MAKIQFEEVTLQYLIYNSPSMSLRNQFMHISTGGRLSKESKDILAITALDKVSFEFNDGDSIGIIGHNGAGKTTLLRTIAGLLYPISGKITREGKITTILELGAGLDLELTGYENIFRMGLLLGLSKTEIESMITEIEEFTELGDFLLAPVRTYSSGMQMRLMFAVATSANPEILLVDEMFSTGDINFQKKADKKMQSIIENAKIVIFSSHDFGLLKRICKKIYKMHQGTIAEVK